MRKRLWKGRTGGGTLGQRALHCLFRYVDVRFGYFTLYFIVPFYMFFARANCLAIFRYFRERQKYGIWKSWWATYRNHYLFGQTLLDKFALFSGQGERYRLTITGQELFEKALDADKGCIVLSSHVGNFEIAGYLLAQKKKRIHSIVFGQEALVVQQYREKIFEAHNVTMIPVAEDMSHIFAIHAALKSGEIVSMPCDRVFSGNKRMKMDFLGREAFFPTRAYHLADRFKTGVLVFFVMKESALHYHVYIHELKTDAKAENREERITNLASAFVKELEKIVLQYPTQWYNYYNFWNTHA